MFIYLEKILFPYPSTELVKTSAIYYCFPHLPCPPPMLWCKSNKCTGLYAENYSIVMKEIKEGLNKWREILCSWMRRLNSERSFGLLAEFNSFHSLMGLISLFLASCQFRVVSAFRVYPYSLALIPLFPSSKPIKGDWVPFMLLIFFSSISSLRKGLRLHELCN